MLGSNSADTAGNRVRATTKEQLFARFGQWSAQAKAAYDPDGSTDLATLVSRANDDFGQAEPARFAASAFAANGSPVYLYRFSYVQTAMRERFRAGTPHGGEIALRIRHFGYRMLRAAATSADNPGSGGLSDGAKLLGQLRQDRRSEWCGLAGLAALRSEQGFDLRFPSRWLGWRGSGSLESAAGRDAVGHRIGEARRFLRPLRLVFLHGTGQFSKTWETSPEFSLEDRRRNHAKAET